MAGARVLLNIDAFWIGLNVRLVVVHDESRRRLPSTRPRRRVRDSTMRDAAAGRALSRAIESTLGRAAFEAFRATSRAFQRDRVSCERFPIASPPSSTPTRASSEVRDARTTRSAVGSSPSSRAGRPPLAERDERASDTVDRECRVGISNRASSSSAAPSTPRRRRLADKPSASATLPAMITKTRRRPTNARRGVA